MYRSIIVPLDRSAVCEYALPVATQIAHGSDATLRLVCVPHLEHAGALEGDMPREAALPARRGLPPHAYLDDIHKRLALISDLRMSVDVLDEPRGDAGMTGECVSDADLVVLAICDGSQPGRSRLSGIMDALVRWRPAPLLVLRPDSTGPEPDVQSDFGRMLIPLDGSAAAEQILAPATALGKVMQASYMLLRVIGLERFVDGAPAAPGALLDGPTLTQMHDEAQGYLDSIALLMRAEGFQVDTRVVVAPDMRTAIQQVAEQQAIDVIAMTTHRRGGLDRLLIGGLAVQVLHDSRVPVLLYQPQERREHAGRA